MKTDWQLVRELMDNVIDACEALENLNLTHEDRNALLEVAPANVYDALQSLWIYPENVRDEVVGLRHEQGNHKPYTHESARALVNAAKVCAELVGTGDDEKVQEPVRKMASWYSNHLIPQVTSAVGTKRTSPVA